MRAITATVTDEYGAPLPGIVEFPVVIEETVGKASVYEIPVRMEVAASADPRWWKGSTINLSIGDVPANTSRRLVIDGRKRRYDRGGHFVVDLSCKCTAGRMRRTRQDAVWKNMTPKAILQAMALRYGLLLDTDSPDAITALVTIRQLSTDWEQITEIGRALDADVYVIGRTLFVKDRSSAMLKIPVRRYVYGSHPFDFEIEESVDGRLHAKAANEEHLVHDPLTGQVSINGKVIAVVTGSQLTFVATDPGGLVKTAIPASSKTPEAAAWLAAGAGAQSIPGVGWVTPIGQYDAGKGMTRADWAAVFTNNKKAQGVKTGYRDRASKGILTYTEWDPRGVPALTTKIQVVMDDPVSSGIYYVLSRRITLIPDRQVELTVTRHATNYTGGKTTGKTTDTLSPAFVEAEADKIEAEQAGSIEKTPVAPDGPAVSNATALMDYGG